MYFFVSLHLDRIFVWVLSVFFRDNHFKGKLVKMADVPFF